MFNLFFLIRLITNKNIISVYAAKIIKTIFNFLNKKPEYISGFLFIFLYYQYHKTRSLPSVIYLIAITKIVIPSGVVSQSFWIQIDGF